MLSDLLENDPSASGKVISRRWIAPCRSGKGVTQHQTKEKTRTQTQTVLLLLLLLLKRVVIMMGRQDENPRVRFQLLSNPLVLSSSVARHWGTGTETVVQENTPVSELAHPAVLVVAQRIAEKTPQERKLVTKRGETETRKGIPFSGKSSR